MTKTLNVLYGFMSDTIEKSITKEIMLRGYMVNPVKRTTKDLIKEYVKSHPELDVVILKEYLDGGGKYSPIELTELVDDVINLNVVIVLSTNHCGKNEMRELYSAGILNAFFSDAKFGANPDKLADLACSGRTRRKAREYYKINETVPDHINITYEEYLDNYRYLLDSNYGLNIIDRFVTISQMLYPGQMGGFIDALPEKVINILLQYQEFYDIANKIYRLGYSKQSYKKQKNVKKGITPEDINKKIGADAKKKNVEKKVEVTAAEVKVQSKTDAMNLAALEDEEKIIENSDAVEEEMIVEKEVETVKSKKKGLFGKKKQRQKQEDDSIFSQDGDIKFNEEGVEGERISAQDEWEEGNNDVAQDVPGTVSVEDIGDSNIENIHDEGPKVQKEESTVVHTNLEKGQQEIDYSKMSAEELMKLLGN